jgi:uncharacterized FAD-dependent dehydrogenase
MLRLAHIRLAMEHTEDDLKAAIVETLGIDEEDLVHYRICRKSVDARKRHAIFFIYSVDVEIANEEIFLKKAESSRKIGRTHETTYRFVGRAPDNPKSRPIVVGAGPCGLFAALTLAQMGFMPLLLERGKKVKERTRDVSLFWRTGRLDPESNALFGEGGAGAFSDGKLATQIKDRENRCRKVLEELAAAGAPEEILYLNKPHIGTDLLIKVIGNLRQAIRSHGGETRFESRVVDILIDENEIRGVVLDSGEKIRSDCVILAIGHSARDTYEMLSEKEVVLEPKPFSLGFRIEHPQRMIDAVQYGKFARHPKLGAADYKLAHHCSNGRSAYTFCISFRFSRQPSSGGCCLPTAVGTESVRAWRRKLQGACAAGRRLCGFTRIEVFRRGRAFLQARCYPLQPGFQSAAVCCRNASRIHPHI